MDIEYNPLIQFNQTWILVNPPVDRSVVTTQGLICCKYKVDDSLARFKAPLVARGFSQQPQINNSDINTCHKNDIHKSLLGTSHYS